MLSANITKIKSFLKKLEGTSFWYSKDFHPFVDEVSEYLGASLGKQAEEKFLGLVVKGEGAGYDRSSAKMKSYLTVLVENLESQSEIPNTAGQTNITSSSTQTNKQGINNSTTSERENKPKHIFIVHGHDNEAKETVARFVEKLGLRAVILHEQPNHGRTIIEKFEEFSDKISFAIVLLTPDDFGASKSDLKNPKLRARQNVIYELGFFNAKLSRARVFVLKKGDVEILSDYLGVIYEEMDEKGSWKNKLVVELEDANVFISPENLKKALLS